MHQKLIAAAALSLSFTAFAQDAGVAAPPAAPLEPPPPAAEIKRVQDYLENGKDRGPALLDVIPCLKVDQTKGSPTQYQCIELVTGTVNKGTTVYAWMQWFTPKGGEYDDVRLQYFHEKEIIQTIDLALKGGFGRTRTFRGHNLTRVGRWTIKLTRGDKELGSATVDVKAN